MVYNNSKGDDTMLWRKYETAINEWINSSNHALLITGARQIGKTFLIREMCQNSNYQFIEFNLIDQPEVVEIINNSSTAKELLMKLQLVTRLPLVKNKTIIFFDEIQEAKEIVTKIKFLVDDGTYKYIMSGSLLGVELHDIRSVPVGYMETIDMYPLNFLEFIKAMGIQQNTIDLLYDSFQQRIPIDDYIHRKMMELFYLYLIIGGMPDAVKTYLETNNIQTVSDIHQNIIRLYRQDFTKHETNYSLKLKEIYDLIPSELNKQNKRFIFSYLNKELKFDRYEKNFLWLKDAGVALPIYNIDEPKVPLIQSKNSNLFKLFMNDVGLLTAHFSNDIKLKILNKNVDINNESLFENAIAQELTANGLHPFYYRSGKLGELDFVVEVNGECIPIEVKSGKNYKRHSALNNVMKIENYHISTSYVLADTNIHKKDSIVYLPIYLCMFIKNSELENPIYKLDLSGL